MQLRNLKVDVSTSLNRTALYVLQRLQYTLMRDLLAQKRFYRFLAKTPE